MIWNIITDSSCDLSLQQPQELGEEIRYYSVPFIITAGTEDFVDDDRIDIDMLVDAMEHEKKASHTACPSPAIWADHFRREGNSIAITISRELSGSYNSAVSAQHLVRDELPDQNIAIINSISAGAGLVLTVRKICEHIRAGKSFSEVVRLSEEIAAEKRTIFALCSFDNLIKNGRMSPIAGFVAKRLGFWGIGIGTQQGKISIKGKVRGAKKALYSIIEDMKEWGKPVHHVVISHCQNREMAEHLRDEILSRWKGIPVEIHPTRGLCSYYAERHGLIVSYI